MRVLGCRRRAGGADFGRDPQAEGSRIAARADGGFTIVETMVALGVIFAVLVGMLASLDTGIRGLATGRQRTGATAFAKEIVEKFRATDYDNVGHKLDTDTTLSTDPRITGTTTKYYQPEGVTSPEPLASATNPPFANHQWTESRDGSEYTARYYVTTVVPTLGDNHKRLTVAVSWANAQYDTASFANEVRVSTLVYNYPAGTASSSISGEVDVDTGTVTITGTLAGVNLQRGILYFPLVHADVEGKHVAEALGYAGSGWSELSLTSGSASGCGTSGTTAGCDFVKANTLADNDGGTAPPLSDSEGPMSFAGGTVAAGSPLFLTLGTGSTVSSASSAESCTVCSPAVGDGDGLLYGTNTATSPSMSSGFDSGLVEGSLVSIGSSGASTATIDSDPVVTDQKVVSTGRQVVPAVSVVSLSPAPLGFTSAVSIGAVDVSAMAAAGPTAGQPSVTGSVVSIQVYDTNGFGLPYYRSVNVTPGVSSETTATAGFTVGGGLLPVTQVTLDTTIRSTAKSLSWSPISGTIEEAEADVTNWLVVSVRLRIVEAGITVADLTTEVDYGRLVAEAEFSPA